MQFFKLLFVTRVLKNTNVKFISEFILYERSRLKIFDRKSNVKLDEAPLEKCNESGSSFFTRETTLEFSQLLVKIASICFVILYDCILSLNIKYRCLCN